MQRLIFLFLILMLSNCSSNDPEKDALVKVFDSYLYRSDVLKMIPYGTAPGDSAALAKDYIDQWVKRNIVLMKAELNLTTEQKDVKSQLEDYRSSLIIFAYERELIRQKLDTTISSSEIETYYKTNPANFELKSNIIRLKYIKLPLKAPNADKAKAWLNNGDRQRLEQYCSMYAVNYLLDDDNWLLFDDVLKEIPLAGYDVEQFNGKRRFIELKDKDNAFLYLVLVSGFMVKESNAPLSFERNNIRNIILNKRKIRLIEQMQQEAYNDALNKKDIEVYVKENE